MSARRLVVACAAVLAAWAAALAIEHVVVGYAFRSYFAGGWEILLVRRVVIPIGIAALAPFAPLAVGFGALALRAEDDRKARVALSVIVGVLAGVAAYGVTTGRHFASVAVRAPAVAVVAIGVGIVGGWAIARGGAVVKDDPLIAAVGGCTFAAAMWCGDLFVLPRLYPAFHSALYVLTLAGVALAAGPLVGFAERRWALFAAAGVIVGVAMAIGVSPANARKLATASNVRLELVEHAPLLGRAVVAAARIAAPPSLDDDAQAASVAPPGEIARALDWAGDDVVLLTVDALRADHVGAYGYGRATTPAIDALAKEGARFEHAYCPTPHTSYSITSMMTGKYMRPLLGLGLGEGSLTWAAALRRYGYRTAAFYPPAVFFVDEERFAAFESSRLDFEYAKIEFAGPALRAAQVAKYLDDAPKDRPLFLWVHFFEPHEPYVMHPEHPFGGAAAKDVDAYDSEIAAADEGIGTIIREVRAQRPRAVVIVTADHGEEFGDHGGRYHGTTVYEEQVRVPLVVAGPGVKVRAVEADVQTIDLLPTVLSALGIPRPARVRGRDLGGLLAGADDAGLAMAETDDYALLARGGDRLVCERRAAACALYRDLPGERRDVAGDDPKAAGELRGALRSIERDHGRFEIGEGAEWPEAIRRGLQGDADAAGDVAALLDDANVGVRRKAAEVTFGLHAPSAMGQVKRALSREEDEETRRWETLALVRGGDASVNGSALLHDAKVEWRRRAALAMAENGDGRGEGELVAWWGDRSALSFTEERELLSALGRIKARSGVGALTASLEDVRLRPYVVSALAAIGDASARPALLNAFSNERYVSMRSGEAKALIALGAREELRAALTRFAGVPEPMRDAIGIAKEAGLLDARHSGIALDKAATSVDTVLAQPETLGPLRLLVLGASPGGKLGGSVGGQAIGAVVDDGALHVVELGRAMNDGNVPVHLSLDTGIVAAWLVARSDELPPPAPKAWTPPPGAEP